MKNIIITLLVLLIMWVPSMASEPFTQDQADRFNTSTGIYMDCVLEHTLHSILEGYTPSYGIDHGADVCIDHSVEIIGILVETKSTDEEIQSVFDTYFFDLLTEIEFQWNEKAYELNQKKDPIPIPKP